MRARAPAGSRRAWQQGHWSCSGASALELAVTRLNPLQGQSTENQAMQQAASQLPVQVDPTQLQYIRLPDGTFQAVLPKLPAQTIAGDLQPATVGSAQAEQSTMQTMTIPGQQQVAQPITQQFSQSSTPQQILPQGPQHNVQQLMPQPVQIQQQAPQQQAQVQIQTGVGTAQPTPMGRVPRQGPQQGGRPSPPQANLPAPPAHEAPRNSQPAAANNHHNGSGAPIETLFVDCIPLEMTKRELAHIFRPFGGFKVRMVHPGQRCH